MQREWTVCAESKVYYSIIKAVVLNNIVHHEDTSLKLQKTHLYLDIQVQIIRTNISTLHEMSWGHADKPVCWGQPSVEPLSWEER